MIFELVKDFADVLNSLPKDHLKRRNLSLLDEAIRRDVHFIDRHPTTFFQCMWNTCWWYDSSESVENSSATNHSQLNFTEQTGISDRLSDLMQHWRHELKSRDLRKVWLRALNPPQPSLGTTEKILMAYQPSIVSELTLTDDGQRCALAYHNGYIDLLHLETGMRERQFSPPKDHTDANIGSVYSISFCTESQELLATYRKYGLCVWSLNTGQQIRQFELSEPRFLYPSSTLCGRRQLVVEYDVIFNSVTKESSAKLWLRDTLNCQTLCELPVSKVIEQLPFRDKKRATLSISESGEYLAHVLEGGLCIWNLSQQQLSFSIYLGLDAYDQLSISDDGRWCLIQSSGDLFLIDCFARRLLNYRFKIDYQFVSDRLIVEGDEKLQPKVVSIHPDGQQIAIATDDYLIRIWDIDDILKSSSLTGRKSAFTADGQEIDFACGEWLPEEIPHKRIQYTTESHIYKLFLTRKADSIMGLLGDGSVRIWDVAQASSEERLKRTTHKVLTLDYSSDGRWLVTGSYEDGVKLWDTTTGRIAHLLTPQIDRPNRAGFRCTIKAKFSPDSKILATFHGFHTVLWETINFSQMFELDSSDSTINDLFFSPDGKLLVIVSDSKSVQIWNTENGTAIHCFHDSFYCDSVAFSQDGQFLFLAVHYKGGDSKIRTYQVSTFEEVRTLACGKDWWIKQFAFLDEHEAFVAQTSEKLIRICFSSKNEKWHKLLEGQGDLRGMVDSILNSEGYRALIRDKEMIVENCENMQVAAYYPTEFEQIVQHPHSQQWAASIGSNVYQLRCEVE